MAPRIPESQIIRRLSAGLATSLTATLETANSLDMAQSARHYMRRFPWIGIMVPVRKAKPLSEGTVGQYFAQFNWAGLPSELDEQDTEKPHDHPTTHLIERAAR